MTLICQVKTNFQKCFIIFYLKIRNYGPSELRTFGITDLRNYEPSELRSFGITDLRNYGPSEYRDAPIIYIAKYLCEVPSMPQLYSAATNPCTRYAG